MIGAVRQAKFGLQPFDAELDDEGVWHSANTMAAAVLNNEYAADSHPSQGQFGCAAITAAARDFDGTPEYPPPTQGDPGAVY